MSQPGMARAICDALLGKGLAHFPREHGITLDPSVVLGRLGEELKDVRFAEPADAKIYIDRAKDSLEEVKKLTEYQDQKVSRLLTIIAFLTAAAGTIFSKVVDTYPLHQYAHSASDSGARMLVVGTYGLFGIYLVLVACGALVTFHATQTRFVWAKDESEDASATSAKSFLFFRSILTTNPEAWAAAFLKASVPTKPSDSMMADYYRNYISEAYLVASKVGDKLRYLQPAQAILLWAIRVLLAWLLVLIVAFALIAPVAARSEQTAASTRLASPPSACPAASAAKRSNNPPPPSEAIAPGAAGSPLHRPEDTSKR